MPLHLRRGDPGDHFQGMLSDCLRKIHERVTMLEAQEGKDFDVFVNKNGFEGNRDVIPVFVTPPSDNNNFDPDWTKVRIQLIPGAPNSKEGKYIVMDASLQKAELAAIELRKMAISKLDEAAVPEVEDKIDEFAQGCGNKSLELTQLAQTHVGGVDSGVALGNYALLSRYLSPAKLALFAMMTGGAFLYLKYMMGSSRGSSGSSVRNSSTDLINPREALVFNALASGPETSQAVDRAALDLLRAGSRPKRDFNLTQVQETRRFLDDVCVRLRGIVASSNEGSKSLSDEVGATVKLYRIKFRNLAALHTSTLAFGFMIQCYELAQEFYQRVVPGGVDTSRGKADLVDLYRYEFSNPKVENLLPGHDGRGDPGYNAQVNRASFVNITGNIFGEQEARQMLGEGSSQALQVVQRGRDSVNVGIDNLRHDILVLDGISALVKSLIALPARAAGLAWSNSNAVSVVGAPVVPYEICPYDPSLPVNIEDKFTTGIAKSQAASHQKMIQHQAFTNRKTASQFYGSLYTTAIAGRYADAVMEMPAKVDPAYHQMAKQFLWQVSHQQLMMILFELDGFTQIKYEFLDTRNPLHPLYAAENVIQCFDEQSCISPENVKLFSSIMGPLHMVHFSLNSVVDSKKVLAKLIDLGNKAAKDYFALQLTNFQTVSNVFSDLLSQTASNQVVYDYTPFTDVDWMQNVPDSYAGPELMSVSKELKLKFRPFGSPPPEQRELPEIDSRPHTESARANENRAEQQARISYNQQECEVLLERFQNGTPMDKATYDQCVALLGVARDEFKQKYGSIQVTSATGVAVSDVSVVSDELASAYETLETSGNALLSLGVMAAAAALGLPGFIPELCMVGLFSVLQLDRQMSDDEAANAADDATVPSSPISDPPLKPVGQNETNVTWTTAPPPSNSSMPAPPPPNSSMPLPYNVTGGGNYTETPAPFNVTGGGNYTETPAPYMTVAALAPPRRSLGGRTGVSTRFNRACRE